MSNRRAQELIIAVAAARRSVDELRAMLHDTRDAHGIAKESRSDNEAFTAARALAHDADMALVGFGCKIAEVVGRGTLESTS